VRTRNTNPTIDTDMNRTVLTLALLVACSTAAFAQSSQTTATALEAKVRELLALTGSAGMAEQVMAQMMPALKEMAPGVPESVWDEIEKEMDVDALIDEIVPVYIAEYTEAEIDAMIAFYSTPEGRSVIQKMPGVMAQTMLIGQQWGQTAAMRVFERLQQKGYAPKS
jgi:hypothetical protein